MNWDVEGKQFPNFTMAASRMANEGFYEAAFDVRVERDLRVTIKPTKPSVGPGEEVEIEVTTTDQNGQPVAAEVALAMVDRSLLRLFADRMPPIGTFFYNQTRTSSFASGSSATFTLSPDDRGGESGRAERSGDGGRQEDADGCGGACERQRSRRIRVAHGAARLDAPPAPQAPWPSRAGHADGGLRPALRLRQKAVRAGGRDGRRHGGLWDESRCCRCIGGDGRGRPKPARNGSAGMVPGDRRTRPDAGRGTRRA